MKKLMGILGGVLFAALVTGCQQEPEKIYVQVDYNRPTYESVQVGDVILSDGTIIPYLPQYGFTAEQREKAIAVVVYSNQQKAICVGLNTEVKKWAAVSYATSEDVFQVELKKKDGSDFAEEGNLPNGYISDIGSYEGYSCGINSYAMFTTAIPGGYIDSYYPAYTWINSYGSSNSLTGAYADQWYMPALQEILYVYENYSIIDSVFSALNKSMFNTAWSSSLSNCYPYHLDFLTGEVICITPCSTLAFAVPFHNVVLN